MPDFDLSVTICSWNARDDLRKCLQHLREAKDEALFEVIVVENNSEDGSGEMVATEFPEVRLLLQTKNLGFTGGHNLAVSQRGGRHVFLLNSDAFVHPGCIATLVKAAASEPYTGVIGPKLLNGDGSLQYSCRRFPNPVAAMFRNTILGRLFPNNSSTRDYLMKEWDHSSRREVDWVSGAAMLWTEAALEKVGSLDPEFFMYCEDVDYCWRSWAKGLKVVYLPEAVATHLIGRSTDKAPNRMIFRFHRSMLKFFVKHQLPLAPWPIRPFYWMFAVTGLSVRAGLFFIKNKVDVVKRRLAR